MLYNGKSFCGQNALRPILNLAAFYAKLGDHDRSLRIPGKPVTIPEIIPGSISEIIPVTIPG